MKPKIATLLYDDIHMLVEARSFGEQERESENREVIFGLPIKVPFKSHLHLVG
jgi:hypothetical protein